MKKKVRLFVSYAKRNQDLAIRFVSSLKEYAAPSRRFDYEFWQDTELLFGEHWHTRILQQLAVCEGGLLLFSPSFLQSSYIEQVELPALLQPGKVVLPVALGKLNLSLHDLKGLDARQIYFFRDTGFRAPRSYSELKARRREDFIDGLFSQMEAQLATHFL